MGPEAEAAATSRVSMMLSTVSAAEGPDEAGETEVEASSEERQSSRESNRMGIARRDGRRSFSLFFFT